jgi:hypothetical protein
MEGEREGCHVWRSMEGEGEGSLLGGQWKEKEKVPMLGGQWKVPSLVANGKFQAWWPMLGERKILFTFFHFPPNQFYLNLQFFPLTLRFYFTMVLSHYSRISFLSLIYKLRLCISM